MSTIFNIILIILVILIVFYSIYSYGHVHDMEPIELPEKKFDTIISLPKIIDTKLPWLIRDIDFLGPDIVSGTGTQYNLKNSESIYNTVQRAFGNGFESRTSLNRTNTISSKMIESFRGGGPPAKETETKWRIYNSASMKKFTAPVKEECFDNEDQKTYSATLVYEWEDTALISVSKLQRLEDDKIFLHVTITLNPDTDFEVQYKNLDAAVSLIVNTFPDNECIFTGDWVHGHEKVFKRLYPTYHICDFTKMPTLYTKDGISSPNGLVVSDKLYDRVEYSTELSNHQSYGSFIIRGKLYISHETPGAFIDNEWKLDKMIDGIVKRADVDISLYGNPGTYDEVADAYSGDFSVGIVGYHEIFTTYTMNGLG
jgi:hypothetical protein